MSWRPPPLIFPQSLDPIGYILGLADAARLARASHPHPVQIPAPGRLPDAHILVEVLGREKAVELCEEMMGERWQPPSEEELAAPFRAREIFDWADFALLPREIAEKTGQPLEWVERVLSARQLWCSTQDLELVCRETRLSKPFVSLLLNHRC